MTQPIHRQFGSKARVAHRILSLVPPGKRVWVEYRSGDGDGDESGRLELVSHNSASRSGEPFAALVHKFKVLPNPVARNCTKQLKLVPMSLYMRSQGYRNWDAVIGIRADEPLRVARMRRSAAERHECWENVLPLADAGVTELDVLEFWQSQPFDLRLRPHEGNCNLCFLKSRDKLLFILAEHPEFAELWVAWEAMKAEYGITFRKDRAPYARLAMMAAERRDLLLNNQPTLEAYLEALRSQPAVAHEMFAFLTDQPDDLGDCVCHD